MPAKGVDILDKGGLVVVELQLGPRGIFCTATVFC